MFISSLRSCVKSDILSDHLREKYIFCQSFPRNKKALFHALTQNTYVANKSRLWNNNQTLVKQIIFPKKSAQKRIDLPTIEIKTEMMSHVTIPQEQILNLRGN